MFHVFGLASAFEMTHYFASPPCTSSHYCGLLLRGPYSGGRNFSIVTVCSVSVRQLVEWDKRLTMHKDEHGNTPLHLAAKYGKVSHYE